MEKILVIDDDKVIRVILRQLFEHAGYEVCVASDGQEGIEMYTSESPDLVVTDLIMPEKEGIEVIKEMIKSDPAVKIIAISGGGVGKAQVYLGLARSFGAAHVFEKPLNVQQMLETVDQMLHP